MAVILADYECWKPNHAGSMAQIGFNAGSRDKKIFGPAQSYIHAKTMATDALVAGDQGAIAALTMMWGLVNTHMPTDVMDQVNARLEDAGMPRMATRNIGEGMWPFPSHSFVHTAYRKCQARASS